MDGHTYVTSYSNYNDVPAQERGYAHGKNQQANWRYLVETTTVERVHVPASGYPNFVGGRKNNELFKEYIAAYAPNHYHEGYELIYGPSYESSSPPNFHEHEELMNNFLKKIQVEASRPTNNSNISGPNRYMPTIPNNNWPKFQPHIYPSQDTHMTQNFPGSNKYRPSSPTKYRPSSPVKYRPSSPIKYQPSDQNKYPPSGPNKYPSSPPKYRPSSPTKYRPSSPTKYRPSSPTKYRPSSPTKYRPSSPTKYQPSSPNKYRPSDLTRYQHSGPNKYPSSPPKYRPSSPNKYRPSSPNKYRPSSPTKYRLSSPVKYQPSSPNKYGPSDLSRYQPSGRNKYPSSPPEYRPSSPNKYRSSSPNKYRPSSPTKYRPSSPNKYRQISPTKYRHTSPTKYQQTTPNTITYQPTSPTQNYPSKGEPNMFRSTSPVDKFPSNGPPLDTQRPSVPNKHQPSKENDGVGDISGPKKLWQSIGLPTTRHPVTSPTNNIDEALSYLAEPRNHSPRSGPNRAGVFDNLSPRAQPLQSDKLNANPKFGGGIARRLFRSNTIDSQEAIKKYGGASVP